jgi:tRNA A37 threonylcarbamoyladenosine biosynthesis protein TsaE
MRSYPIKKGDVKRLLHVDAYRIEHPSEILALDLDEELADRKIAVAIEWPENITAWLKGRKVISIRIK